MKRILLFSLLSVIFLWPGSCPIATAQEPEGASSGQIILGDGEEIQEYSTRGKFAPLTVEALETNDVTLQFSTSLAGAPVIVQALDGGALSGSESTTIDGAGKASLQFQVGDQPGVYRVLVIAEGTVSMVQFEVPNPEE
jgi:hypothetical protein